jgi:glycosyltransferase involved in cell wall biosynthesis
MATQAPRLVLCSKSTWTPAIRREHALARLAAARGHDVIFLEQPTDVRSLAGAGRAAWLAQLLGSEKAREIAPHLDVVPRATVLPPHRGQLAETIERTLLGRTLRDLVTPGCTVVATTPMQWRAVSRLSGVRRVFDCADDWSSVLPRWREAMLERHREIGSEADAVIVNAERLGHLFGDRRVTVVPNGTSPDLVATPITPPPAGKTLVYTGTLSERFDVALTAGVLERLPGWRLDLYGQCRYPRCGEAPDPELRGLLAEFRDRVAWHGPVERSELTARLDAGRVLVLPHRPVGAVTGDAMKLYDYAARGRPIVSTTWGETLSEDPPPGLQLADSAEEFAAAVRAAAEEPSDLAPARRAWAEARTWEQRWHGWATAAFGSQRI